MNRVRRLPNAAPEKRLERWIAEGRLPRGWIDGLTLANDTTDATNDISIAAGTCRSTVNIVDGAASTLTRHQRDIEIPVSILKQLDVAWAPATYDGAGQDGGGRSGLRSGSSLANGTWHVYAIGGPGVPDDIWATDSAVQATVLAALPGNYTACRRIGSLLRESAAIVAFVQDGDVFTRKTVGTEAVVVNPGTSAVSRTMLSPVGIRVRLILQAGVNANGSGTAVLGLISDLSCTDEAVSITNANISGDVSGSVGLKNEVTVMSDTSAAIRTRLSYSEATNVRIYANTRGWIDRRDRDA